jgi:hypothetical protein
MVQFFPSIAPHLAEWALKQSVFFTASAPTSGKHINISPKGLPASSLSILSPNQVAYVDATGSGAETISHIYENGRVTLMFCSFDATPRILRLFCTGRVVEWDDREFEGWLTKMGKRGAGEGARAVIVLDVFKASASILRRTHGCAGTDIVQVQTSCGYGVPKLAQQTADAEKGGYGFEDRETLGHWAKTQVDKNAMHAYQQTNNSDSLDGLTGLKSARRDRGERLWMTDTQAWVRKVWGQKDAVAVGFVFALWAYIVMMTIQRL